jgi:hypothetical protein
VGETISGRIVDVSGNRMKVEVGEGVTAECRIASKAKTAPPVQVPSGDISSMTAMLSARWKKGTGPAAAEVDELRGGQIRSFRIAVLDAVKRKIEVELIG